MSWGGNTESSTNQSWFTDEQKERAKVAGAWVGAVAGIAVAAWGIFKAFSDSGPEPATDKKKMKLVGTEDSYMYRDDLEKIDIPAHVVAKLRGDLGRHNEQAIQQAPPQVQEPNLTLIAWKFPIAGTMKVNTDGGCNNFTGRGSYGGVVRNDQGAWVVGFYGNMKGKVTILQAELEGIYRGLKLIKERGWSGATVETDSTLAVQLISKTNAENHPLCALIEDCIELSLDTGTRMAHTLREGNKCADKMAKLGKLQEMNYDEVEEPPSDITDQLLADLQGTCYRRGS